MPAWTPAPYALPYIAANDVLEQTPATNKAQMEKISEYLQEVAGAPGLPIGTLTPYAGGWNNAAPPAPGWLLCNGQAVSRADYEDLWNVIGASYGAGDGSTTFNIPDLRGRAPIGSGQEGSTATTPWNDGDYTLGLKYGDKRLHSHGHSVTDGPHNHGLGVRGDGSTWNALNNNAGPPAATFYTTDEAAGISIHAAGEGTQENVPPSLAVNFIIFAINP